MAIVSASWPGRGEIMRLCAYAVALGLIAAGAASTAVAQSASDTKPDPTLLPYLNQSNSVKLPDGRRLHFTCMGRGSPTVILMAGLGDWGATWNKVQPQIAAKTRICAWDRAGFGFSDASPVEQTITATTNDLIAALDIAGFGKPYVLVAHSLGGLEALMTADRRPQQVAGMVLVDSSIPDQMTVFGQAAPVVATLLKNFTAQTATVLRRCAEQIRSGKVAIGTPDPDDCLHYPPTYPPVLSAALAHADSNPDRADTGASLFAALEKDMKLAINPRRNYRAMSLTVLSATEMQGLPPQVDPDGKAQRAMALALNDGHDAIAKLSTHGSNRPVPGASHYIQRLRPDVVVAAVDEVVAKVRSSNRGSR